MKINLAFSMTWRNAFAIARGHVAAAMQLWALGYGAVLGLTVLRYLLAGEPFTKGHVLFFNPQWTRANCIDELIVFWAIFAVVGYAKSGKHSAYKVSAVLLAFDLMYRFLDFGPASAASTHHALRYEGVIDSALPIGLTVYVAFSCVGLFYAAGLALLWFVRRMIKAVRAAHELRLAYRDESAIVFATNVLLAFVGGEHEAARVADDLMEAVEHVRDFNLTLGRRQYFMTAIRSLPGVVYSELRKDRSKEKSEISYSPYRSSGGNPNLRR